tara:strand:+ start:5719 stop:7233 length:1515 start_codon:yes stop_codon:yes gene_type:complete
MTENQYIEVCKLTDEILEARMSSSTRVAIPWLHVVRAHHVFLEEYEAIYDSSINSNFKNIKRKIRNLFMLLVVLIQSLFYSSYSKWLKNIATISKVDVLFLSHLLNKSQYDKEDDFYFSDLPQKASISGLKSLTVMVNHNGVRIQEVRENKFKKIVLPIRLGICSEIKNVALLWSEYKALKNEMRLEKNKIKKKVLYFAAIESLSHKTLFSLRLGLQIKGLVKTLGPKTLITTHEGHAWERKVFDSARMVSQNIQCIGYTHAPIFEKQHAVKRNLDKQYNPDVILNSGFTQKNQLQQYGLLNNIKIEVLGSIRSTNNLVEDSNLKIIKNSKIIKNKFCLVVPEGSKKEMSILFDFSLECSKAMPECQFIWRLHPLFDFNDKFFKNKKYWNLPNNIILSDQNLNYDLLRSEWVLYRASSVVIQAIVAGLKPIYLHRANEIKIDSIHEIRNWKSEVVSVEEFKSTLTKILGNFSDYEEAQKYCMSVYSPLNAKILINIIRKKISNG